MVETLLEASELEDLVRKYFRGVDGEDLERIFQTLNDDCVFSVETHRVHLQGKDQISAMFRRLWADHYSVRHDRFRFVSDPGSNRVAVQFRVTNTLINGQQVFKSNCNFFEVAGSKFQQVSVYMAGENTLNLPNSI